MLTGWRYWYRRYLGWVPFQPCFMCERWYWGGFPIRGWQACYKEFCSKDCFDDAARSEEHPDTVRVGLSREDIDAARAKETK